MNTLVNDKQTYEELKRDPTPTLQRRLDGKLLSLKKAGAFDNRDLTIRRRQAAVTACGSQTYKCVVTKRSLSAVVLPGKREMAASGVEEKT